MTLGWTALPVAPSLLGESPFWHPDEAALYWCDIPGKALNRWHAPTGHRANTEAEQHRRGHTRNRKDASPAALHAVARAVVGAKGERRPAQDDADQHQRDRHVQRRGQVGVRARKTGEQEHHHENEPHMVGFPDGADGFGDECTLFVALSSACQQIPDATAKIGAAEEHVRVEREHHYTGHGVRQCPGQFGGIHDPPTVRPGRAGVGIGISPVSPTGTAPRTPVLRICRRRRNTTVMASPM